MVDLYTGTVPNLTQSQPEFDTNTQAILDYIANLAPQLNALISAYVEDTSTTSTTSNSIGTGSKTFSVQSGKGYKEDMTVRASAGGGNFMDGLVTSYSGTSLTVDFSSSTGSGTFSDWNIFLTISTGETSSFSDSFFEILDNVDDTKKLKFQLSGISTGTTRTLSSPNKSGTMALTSDLGQMSGITYYNSNQSISSSLAGNMIAFTGSTASQTLTLPAANTLLSGGGLWFVNQATVNVTVSRSSTDTINKNTLAGVANATTIILQPGDCIFLASDGTSLWDMAGQLFGDAFSNSLGASGWQKLPNGLIEQWGSGTTSAGSLAITFPIQFNTACYAFTPAPAQNGNYTASYASLTATGVTVFTYVGNTGVGANIAISWRATGK